MDLSVLIPAKNEEFLNRTILDLLQNIEGNTEIIAVLDGYVPEPPLTGIDPRVTIIYNPESVGQRIASNQAAKLAKGKYVMKVDAHCAFDKGFDVKMIEAFKEVGDDVTMVPTMRNLHAFDWVCPDGHRRYQGPSGPCKECGKDIVKDIVWIAKTNPQSNAFRFDKTMHFQYHGQLTQEEDYKKGVLVGFKLSFDTHIISSRIVDFLTDFANSHLLACSRDDLWFRKNMAMYTVSLSSIDSSWSSRTQEIFGISNKFQVKRIATSSVITEMVNNKDISTSTSRDISNQPSIDNTVCEFVLAQISEPSISIYGQPANPVPTGSRLVNAYIVKKLNSVLGGEFIYNEKTSSLHNGSVTLTPIYDNELNETLSLQGSCFMCTKEKYFELGLCGEEFNSWGQQGVEVACKTWLSGGRVLVNRRTWYAHMFRTQGGDFSFPYANPYAKILENRELSRKLFQMDGWPKATHKFQWLLDKFNPPEWGISKGICFYSDNTCDGTKLGEEVKSRLAKISRDKKIPITTACLKKIDLGVKNIYFPSLERGILTMFKQILAALENCPHDIVYLCEADVIYDPSHFDFTPPRKDIVYYNQNNWQLRVDDGFAVYFDCKRVSQICAYRDILIEHYRKRIKIVEEIGFSNGMGYEPGSHNRPQRVDNLKSDIFISEVPNIDLAHGTNVTRRKWRPEDFRSQRNCQNWKEGFEIPGYGDTRKFIKLLQ